MTSLLAARRQHLAAALGLHARAEAVSLGAAAAARLKCALWQSNPPFVLRSRRPVCFTRKRDIALVSSAAVFEFISVCDPCGQGQENQTNASKLRDNPGVSRQHEFSLVNPGDSAAFFPARQRGATWPLRHDCR